ncbi:helix-turn-helix domain-containing protein [Enterobacter chengduensis]|uniref:helix-turn-helix domain-containing protein n=1 Tax=Enterobacter chengduensis TaxID=2494701 RepID=UPI003D6DE53F
MSNQIRIAKTIGKRILNQRVSLRLSQDFLADHLGLTTETINDWETEKTVPFSDQLIQLANVLHSDVLWLISGNDEYGEFTEPTSIITSNQLNSWSADIGNCRMAISNAMDCMPQELSVMGTLTIVYEKLDELQETIRKQADKI